MKPPSHSNSASQLYFIRRDMAFFTYAEYDIKQQPSSLLIVTQRSLHLLPCIFQFWRRRPEPRAIRLPSITISFCLRMLSWFHCVFILDHICLRPVPCVCVCVCVVVWSPCAEVTGLQGRHRSVRQCHVAEQQVQKSPCQHSAVYVCDIQRLCMQQHTCRAV